MSSIKCMAPITIMDWIKIMVSIKQIVGYHGRAIGILCAVLATTPLAGNAQDRYPVDWPAIAAESVEYFAELLRTDTSNHPPKRRNPVSPCPGFLLLGGWFAVIARHPHRRAREG